MGTLLEGKRALITGSSRGIGRAAALAMAREGADVVIHYRRQEEQAALVAEEVRKLGRQCLVVKAELEDPEEVRQLFGVIEDAWGGLDVFMANAAATTFKSIQELKPHHLDRTYRLVVDNLVLATQLAVPLMAGRQGRIITISGHGVPFTLPGYANIGSAKAAVEALTRYLAYELGPQGITCNAIAPGVIMTDSASFYVRDRLETFSASCIRATPLGRLGTAEDVAEVAVFLASAMSRFITGQVIRVDGGLTLTSGPFEDTWH